MSVWQSKMAATTFPIYDTEVTLYKKLSDLDRPTNTKGYKCKICL